MKRAVNLNLVFIVDMNDGRECHNLFMGVFSFFKSLL